MTVVGVVLVSGDAIESARLGGTTLIDHAVSVLRGSGVVDVVTCREPVVPAAKSSAGGSTTSGFRGADDSLHAARATIAIVTSGRIP